MNSPLILFGLALVNVVTFEFLYGLLYKILPQDKSDWSVYYWTATFILCGSTHAIDLSNPKILPALAPAAFVAIIHCGVSLSSNPMRFGSSEPSSDKSVDNSSSLSSRIRDSLRKGPNAE